MQSADADDALNEVCHDTDPHYRCSRAAVRRWRVLGSRSRLLV